MKPEEQVKTNFARKHFELIGTYDHLRQKPFSLLFICFYDMIQ
ncbi:MULTISPECIES: hypothetical protein [Bacillaceae]|uniref:Uncharacterized protein n=1 Tax=Parageobacillus toebii TaxID=153151 RepID=A0A150M918_9BACL|nr:MULTISPECIES: hypothetical protein [Bacillaceae]KYD20881.1 hypothetical protein B4110_3898 [Parageobacillus toebii]